jgi:DNA-binding NtrC family response regulator
MKALVAYKWPGNVRELMNVLERAVLLGSGRSIGLEDLPVEMTGYAVNQAVIPQLISEENSNIFKLKWKESRAIVLKQYEKRYFEILLRRYQGKVSVVAKAAGISPRALHQKMIKHKIRKEDFRK